MDLIIPSAGLIFWQLIGFLALLFIGNLFWPLWLNVRQALMAH